MATADECGAFVLCILKNSQSDSKRARILLCPIVTLVRLAVQCGGEICWVTWDETRLRYCRSAVIRLSWAGCTASWSSSCQDAHSDLAGNHPGRYIGLLEAEQRM